MTAFDGQLAIIGVGNMAGAMLRRWLASATLQPGQVQGAERDRDRAAALHTELGIACSTDAAEAVAGARVVLLACKPQQVAALAAQLRPLLPAAELGQQVWVSILAGVSVAQLQTLLPGPRWVRWMPNTPVGLGLGVVGEVAAEADSAALAPLRTALGTTAVLAEAQMDTFTAVAGCGPAYLFALAESLAAAAVSAGLDAPLAEALARQTVVGASALLGNSPLSAEALRVQVTSKGGMTEAALAQLQADGWSSAMTAAVRAAVARAEALRQSA